MNEIQVLINTIERATNLEALKNQLIGVLTALNQTSPGGGDLQAAYDAGNVVNDGNVIWDGVNNINGFGLEVLQNNTGNNINALGQTSAKLNTGNNLNALGNSAALQNSGQDLNALGNGAAFQNIGDYVNALGESVATQNSGDYVNALGSGAASQNSGDNINAFGSNAGVSNTADHCNFFGAEAGNGNQTAFGVTVFSAESIPSYANHAAAAASITTANGAVAGQVYIYRNQSNNTIGYVVP